MKNKHLVIKAIPILLLALLIVFISTSCTTNYRIRKEAKIDTLKLCLLFSEDITDTLKYAFQDQAYKFVSNFNEYEHLFLMKLSDDTTNQAMIIHLSNTKLVNLETQKFATIISVIGITSFVYLTLSGAPIILYFWYFPRVTTIVKTTLSPDLTLSNKFSLSSIHSNGYLLSKKAQLTRHKKSFNRFLRNELDFIEEQYQLR